MSAHPSKHHSVSQISPQVPGVILCCQLFCGKGMFFANSWTASQHYDLLNDLKRKLSYTWGDGSVIKVLALQTQGLSSNAQHSLKQLNIVAPTCNSSTEKGDKITLKHLTLSKSMRDPVSKTRWRPDINLWLHIHKQMHTDINMQYTQKFSNLIIDDGYSHTLYSQCQFANVKWYFWLSQLKDATGIRWVESKQVLSVHGRPPSRVTVPGVSGAEAENIVVTGSQS